MTTLVRQLMPVLALVASVPLHAQFQRGAILGNITDATGGVNSTELVGLAMRGVLLRGPEFGRLQQYTA